MLKQAFFAIFQRRNKYQNKPFDQSYTQDKRKQENNKKSLTYRNTVE
jgi:hypothetical protein